MLKINLIGKVLIYKLLSYDDTNLFESFALKYISTSKRFLFEKDLEVVAIRLNKKLEDEINAANIFQRGTCKFCLGSGH